MKRLRFPRNGIEQLARTSTRSHSNKRVAVLYQALEPPLINGVKKPKKPGGYQDSGADIAYVLSQKCNIPVITPKDKPNPSSDEGWCFPDSEGGILSAIDSGATHLWANTILFSAHPLQTASKLTSQSSNIYVIGQSPRLVELYDDKDLVNTWLKKHGGFSLPRSFSVGELNDIESEMARNRLNLPLVGKPIRGRGSHGVKVCYTFSELAKHVYVLLQESPNVMVEEYLSGQEITITVVPPSLAQPKYWALPVVTRFNHQAGIAPYNGLVVVTQNSKALPADETEHDPIFVKAVSECELVAQLLSCTAPIRIDMRRFEDSPSSNFAIFDVNMKPNMTGPGRPGREDQASLTAMAAAALGWDYPQLLEWILDSACSLDTLRNATPPKGFVREGGQSGSAGAFREL